MSLPRFSVNNPVLVNMLMFAIIGTGGILALTMVREMFPESRPNKLFVTTVHPGVSPQEIEKAITIKIEEAVRDVEGIEKVDSTVSEGLSQTVLRLRTDVKDADHVLQEVKAEVDGIEDLPADAEKTTVKKLVPELPIIAIALYGPGDDAARKRAARALRDELLMLPGVSDVRLSGAKDDEISIEVRPEKLLEYDITFDEVAAAIRDTNLDLSGGQLESNRSLVSVRTLGEKQRGRDLDSLVVRSLPDGRNLFLSDVARIRDEFVESDVEGYFNGQPAISCVVYKTLSQDAIDISQLVKAYVKGKQGAAFDPHAFEDARRQPWYYRPFALAAAECSYWLKRAVGKPDPLAIYEQSRAKPFDHTFQVALHTDLARFIEGRIDLMVDNGFQGLVLVLLALILFLNWRVAFWAAAGIPVTMLGTFVLMTIFGVTLNLVSLMGLIIVLSLDVDEAIVMGENIYRYLEDGLSPRDAALKGAEEVLWPVVVMTATTIGAFIPLMFIAGQLGDFLKMLPLVAIAAMSVSMLEALVILPSHLAEIPLPHKSPAALRHDARRIWLRRVWDRAVAFKDECLRVAVDVWYDRFIRLSLRWRYVTLATAFSTLALSIGLWAGDIVKTVWVQKMDSETLVAALKMPVGTPAAQTRQRLQALSDRLVSLPEVVNVQMFVAVQVDLAGEGATGRTRASHLGQLIVELKEAESRKRSSEEVLAELRAFSDTLTGVNSITWLALNGGPAGKAIEIKVSGEDFNESLAVGEQLKAKLASFRGVQDIDDNLDRGQREVRLRLRESARPTGITVAALGNEVRNAFYGREAKRLTRDREDVKIMVRYPKSYRRDVYSLESMWVPTPPGSEKRGWVPLREVAELTEDQSFSILHRTHQKRALTVYADVDQAIGDEDKILASVQMWFDTEMRQQFPGVRYEFLGKTLETRKAVKSIGIAFPTSLVIIYVLLAALFRSYAQPLVVMIAVPFGVQGAIIGHWLMGYDLTIMSMIGLVALNGIVDNDSLVLVDFINNRVRAGLSHFEASVQGSKLRLRAIILTTVTAVAGMFPLMMETSFQAKFLIPMAITLTFGLIFATALTLVVVPAINMVFFDFQRLLRLIWRGSAALPDEEGEPSRPSERLEVPV